MSRDTVWCETEEGFIVGEEVLMRKNGELGLVRGASSIQNYGEIIALDEEDGRKCLVEIKLNKKDFLNKMKNKGKKLVWR